MNRQRIYNNHALARLAEFFLIFTVFLVIMSSFYAIINTYKPPLIDYTEEDAMRVTEILISTTGMLWNGSANVTDWERYDYNYSYITKYATAVGLAVNASVRNDFQTYGILYLKKIHTFVNNSSEVWYEFIREILSLKQNGYDLNITISIMNETKKYYYFGRNLSTSGFTWKRTVLIYDGGNYTYALFSLSLGKRG